MEPISGMSISFEVKSREKISSLEVVLKGKEQSRVHTPADGGTVPE